MFETFWGAQQFKNSWYKKRDIRKNGAIHSESRMTVPKEIGDHISGGDQTKFPEQVGPHCLKRSGHIAQGKIHMRAIGFWARSPPERHTSLSVGMRGANPKLFLDAIVLRPHGPGPTSKSHLCVLEEDVTEPFLRTTGLVAQGPPWNHTWAFEGSRNET